MRVTAAIVSRRSTERECNHCALEIRLRIFPPTTFEPATSRPLLDEPIVVHLPNKAGQKTKVLLHHRTRFPLLGADALATAQPCIVRAPDCLDIDRRVCPVKLVW